jgi:hypothetical protein
LVALFIFLFTVQTFETALDVALVAAGRFVLRALELCVFYERGAELAPVFWLCLS